MWVLCDFFQAKTRPISSPSSTWLINNFLFMVITNSVQTGSSLTRLDFYLFLLFYFFFFCRVHLYFCIDDVSLFCFLPLDFRLQPKNPPLRFPNRFFQVLENWLCAVEFGLQWMLFRTYHVPGQPYVTFEDWRILFFQSHEWLPGNPSLHLLQFFLLWRKSCWEFGSLLLSHCCRKAFRTCSFRSKYSAPEEFFLKGSLSIISGIASGMARRRVRRTTVAFHDNLIWAIIAQRFSPSFLPMPWEESSTMQVFHVANWTLHM